MVLRDKPTIRAITAIFLPSLTSRRTNSSFSSVTLIRVPGLRPPQLLPSAFALAVPASCRSLLDLRTVSVSRARLAAPAGEFGPEDDTRSPAGAPAVRLGMVLA